MADELKIPVFLSVAELLEIEDSLLRKPATTLEKSRELGVLVGKLGQAREEVTDCAPEW